MITILKIGYSAFAFKNKKHAVQALQALAEGMAVDYSYVNRKEVYFPHDRGEKALSLENVPDSHLVAAKPTEEAPEDRQLKY